MRISRLFTVSQRSLLLLAALLGVTLLGALVPASQAASSSPTRPRFEKSGMVCAWIARNQAHLPADLACPSLSTGEGADLSQGQAGGKSAASAPSQMPTGPLSPAIHFGTNVHAVDFAEDVVSGQVSPVIAASGRYAVAVWNDISGLFFADPTLPQASLTGIGFSNDGGKTFHDLGGLPNNNSCQQIGISPSVVSYQAPGGQTYFYISSLYFPSFHCGPAAEFEGIALTVGTVSPDGQTLALSNPVVVASGGALSDPNFDQPDMPALTIDRVHGKLALSYTNFVAFFTGSEIQIDVAYCTLAAPAAPNCPSGTRGTSAQVIASNLANGEEVEGSFPTFSPAGDLYVAWNQNWSTNLFDGDPFTHQLLARVPASCVAAPPCAVPQAVPLGDPVKSLDLTTIPGYSGGFHSDNDFPQIAFNNTTNQVVAVWNEGNAHPQGDIVMVTASADLRTLSPKVRVNDDHSFAVHFLPAVSVDARGTINVSWYDRRNAVDTARTDVYAASIKVGMMGADNSRVTNVATDWKATGGNVFDPVVGERSSNTSDGTTFYVSWTDGRLGVFSVFVAASRA